MSLIRYTMQKCLFKIVIIMHLTTIQITVQQTELGIFEKRKAPNEKKQHAFYYYIGLHTK